LANLTILPVEESILPLPLTLRGSRDSAGPVLYSQIQHDQVLSKKPHESPSQNFDLAHDMNVRMTKAKTTRVKVPLVSQKSPTATEEATILQQSMGIKNRITDLSRETDELSQPDGMVN